MALLDKSLKNLYHSILLPWFKELEFEGVKYSTIESIQEAFAQLNKRDLKTSVASYINKILTPVRQHFASGEKKNLYEKVMEYCKEPQSSSTIIRQSSTSTTNESV